ncbi:MAG: asparagine synthase (glutamine-hydrolyzing) [Nitrospira sp.]|nr:asparagine synthase (glutamine-hydrolyzing) [Nitrospira sp.]
MCGLCGAVTFAGAAPEPEVAEAMVASLRHRGPDDRGMHTWRNPEELSVFLGHTRLSILDLSQAGHQPISNENGRIWAVFNGEIYNFLSLRSELEAYGHVFKSKTDSEVLVHAYEQYGDDFVRRLDGMFAFALWDQDRERVLLARDRAGKKPLYYHADSSGCVFASEMKALFAHPGVRHTISPEAIALYFTYGYVPCPDTFYRGISQVPPASYVVVERGRVRGPFVFWELRYPIVGEERKVSESEACREVRRLLEAAVERRLLSDVPLGAFLSGGIDSSIVVGLMSRLRGRVKTFSIGFTGDKEFDETPFSRLVARHFETDHTEFVVEPKAFDLVERLLWHHDQPYGDSSAIPTFLLSKLAREHVAVALNGDGGDEVFAGYERFLGGMLSERLPKFPIRLGRALIEVLPRSWRVRREVARAHRFFLQAAKPLAERYLTWCSFFSQDFLAQLLIVPIPPGIRSSFDRCLDETANCSLLHRLLYLNFKTYLPDDLLVKMDRMSMAHALETRSPFLDTALVEYVASLPSRYKANGWTLKYILKKAFADLLPREILTRGKRGFGVPLGAWFRGELQGLVQDLLLGPSPRYAAFVRQEAVRRIHQEHQDNIRDYGAQLWVLLNFELWLRKGGESVG